MAITATVLSDDIFAADATSFVTTSATVHADTPVLVAVESSEATPSTIPTLSGHSLTWTQVATAETNSGATRRRITVFEAYPTANDTGTITVDFAGHSQGNCIVHVIEFANADPTDATSESATGVGNSSGAQTVSLVGIAAGNAVFIAAVINNNTGLTPSAGYTGLGDDTNASPVTSMLTAYSTSDTDAGVNFSIDGATNVRYAAVAIEIQASGIVHISRAAETDEAEPQTVKKTVAISRAAETDTAQAVTAVLTGGGHVVAIGQVTETDSPGFLSVRKVRAVTQPSETDSAQALTHTKTEAVAQASETDVAQTLAIAKAKAIGQATETDSAQVVTVRHILFVTVNQVTSTNTARPLTIKKKKAVGQVTETDEVFALSSAKVVVLTQPSETDAAEAATAVKLHIIAVGQAREHDYVELLTVVGGRHYEWAVINRWSNKIGTTPRSPTR